MFRAAATGTGVATRPLLVFYGLSQAGRAIAAAASGLPATGGNWTATASPVSRTLRGPLPGLRLQAGKEGRQAVSCACRNCSAHRCGPGRSRSR